MSIDVDESAGPPVWSPPEPFDHFMPRMRHRVLRLAYVTSGSRATAEDLAQEAFLAAWRDWERVARMENPEGWILRVVANKSVSHVRRRVAEVKAVARHGPGLETYWPQLSAETEWLWHQVRRLPRRQLQVIALHYLEEMTVLEIADVLGCSKESVHTHMRRARSTLAVWIGTGESS
ncbi:MAG TPA: sigma-70 family RNA polymerase sigma factor [Acidimicrobiia bacterium]|nr:sigma-70 family RNA polymerase sigma factor [Acidimicrobiia bacterium]